MQARTTLWTTTALLALTSAGTALAQTITYTGLEFHSMGQASLALNASGNLVVSNIGSSGQDGIRADVPDAEGATFRFASPVLVEGPGTYGVVLSVRPNVSSPSAPAMWLTLVPDPGGAGVNVHVDNAFAACEVEVQLFEDDVFIDGRIITAENYDAAIPVWNFPITPEAPAVSANGGVWKTTNGGSHSTGTAEIDFVEVAGGGERAGSAVHGRTLRVICRDMPSGPVQFYGLAMTTNDPTPIEIESGAIRKFGFDHTGKGQATLRPLNDRLVLGNIGATGDDGTSIAIEEITFAVEGWERSFDGTTDFAVWQDNVGAVAMTRLEVDGLVGSMTISHSAQADRKQMLTWYKDMQQVGQFEVDNGDPDRPLVLGTVPNLPPGEGVESIHWMFDETGLPLRAVIRLSQPMEFIPASGGGPILIDRIDIENPNPVGSFIDELRICASSATDDSLTIFGESSAPFCPTDFNNDGVTDGADLAALLPLWGAGDSLADLNGDSVVDGADLATLLAAWGDCP